MGSYCSLHLGPYEIFSFKSAVPDSLVALFQDSDLVTATGQGADDEIAIDYIISRDVALTRLALLGFSQLAAEARFSDWLNSERARWESYSVDQNWDFAKPVQAALEALTFEGWRSRVPSAIAHHFDGDELEDVADQHMRAGKDGDWLFFDGYGSLFTLRAILDASPRIEQLRLDIAELVTNGWVAEDGKLCSARRAEDATLPRALAPVVILAEGSSDIRILRRSLAKLYPELVEYYSFFDHQELRVDGGANYLVKFLKAFAAARAPMQLIAVFDNDTVGGAALAAARRLSLPENMILLGLPTIELAKEYPTVGPQGSHSLDVNGAAGSIELYLGREALTGPDCELRPVRWKGYVAEADAYQGEVEGKTEVEQRFFSRLSSYGDAAEARASHPELVAIWQTIFAATEAANMQTQLAIARRYELEW